MKDYGYIKMGSSLLPCIRVKINPNGTMIVKMLVASGILNIGDKLTVQPRHFIIHD